jgi:hypothetical protein
MKKQVITEVTRINELMGIKKQLTESLLGKFGQNIIDDFVTTAKKVSGVADEIVYNSIKMTKSQYDDILYVLENPSFYNALDDVNKAILRKILVQNQPFVDEMYISFLNKLNTQTQNFNEFTFFQQVIAKAENQDKTINNILKDDYGLDDITSSAVTKKIGQKFEAVETTGKFPASKLKPRQGPINNPIKFSKFKAFINEMGGDVVLSLFNIWKRTFKSAQELQKEFINLSSVVDKKMGDNLNAEVELYEMLDVLGATSKYFQNEPKLVYQKWKKLIPQNVVEMIEEQGEKGYQQFFKDLMTDTRLIDQYNVEMKAFAKAWPFRIPGSPLSKGFLIFRTGEGYKESINRFARLIIMTDARTFREMRMSLIKKGTKQALISNILMRAILHALFMAAIGSLITAFRVISSWGENIAEIFSKKQLDWIDYKENPEDTGWSEWLKDLKKVFPKDLEEFFFSIANVTLYDEFKRLIWDPIMTGGQNLDTDGIRRRLEDEARRIYPPGDSTTTLTPDTTSTNTTPPQTSGLPEVFNSFTPYATFEKIDDNKYKMKFKSDLPPDFSDLKNYETTAEKSGDKWIWYYTDGTSMEF